MSATARGAEPKWARWSTQELLDLRFKDLGLVLEKTWVQECVERLYAELDRKGLTLRPHVWFGEEWFSPTDIPGIAVPFYLAHPRLRKLEKAQMLKV